MQRGTQATVVIEVQEESCPDEVHLARTHVAAVLESLNILMVTLARNLEHRHLYLLNDLVTHGHIWTVHASLSLSRSLSLSFCFFSLSLYVSFNLCQSLSLSPSLFSFGLSLSHTHFFSLSLALSPSLSQVFHTLSLCRISLTFVSSVSIFLHTILLLPR